MTTGNISCTTLTVSGAATTGALTASGLITANAGLTVASGQSLTLTGANITGGTYTSDILFTDATYDIGKSGATRPRDLFISRNATVGGTLGVTGISTLGAALKITGGSYAVPSSNGNAIVLASTTDGLVMGGKGSGNDLVIGNGAGANVITIATGTTDVGIVGKVSAKQGVFSGDNAAGTYSMDSLGSAGSDRSIFRAGIATVSNGFTVSYATATTSFTYSFPNVGSASLFSVGAPATFTGVVTSANTTDATSSTAGGTIISGGAAIAKAANIGTTLTVGTTSTLTGHVGIGGASSTTTALLTPASTTGASSIRVPPGTAPSSLVNGDFYNDGTHAYIVLGGVAKQIDN